MNELRLPLLRASARDIPQQCHGQRCHCASCRPRQRLSLEALIENRAVDENQPQLVQEVASAAALPGLPVAATTRQPWSWICSIEITYPEKTVFFAADEPTNMVFGTGTLISPRHVLTCAHLLRRFKVHRGALLPVEPDNIEVVPGRDNQRSFPRPFGTFTSRRRNLKYWTPAEFQLFAPESSSRPHDYALIELSSDVGDRKFLKLGSQRLGWWGSTADSMLRQSDSEFRSELLKRRVNVAGYPGYFDPPGSSKKRAGIPRRDFQNVLNTNVRLMNKQVPLMTYHTLLGSGVSGGPIWLLDACDNRYLVAIHSAHLKDQSSGTTAEQAEGVLITADMMKNLRQWTGINFASSQYSGRRNLCT